MQLASRSPPPCAAPLNIGVRHQAYGKYGVWGRTEEVVEKDTEPAGSSNATFCGKTQRGLRPKAE